MLYDELDIGKTVDRDAFGCCDKFQQLRVLGGRHALDHIPELVDVGGLGFETFVCCCGFEFGDVDGAVAFDYVAELGGCEELECCRVEAREEASGEGRVLRGDGLVREMVNIVAYVLMAARICD